MEGILLEHSGKFQEAATVYEDLLTKTPTDSFAWKRKITVLRTQGATGECIKQLNEYLEFFQGDLEAWEELTDIYMETQHFVQAAFCYEEVLTSAPEDSFTVMRYAEILYSTGILEKVLLSRKYFTQAVVLYKKNVRALWGLWQCCKTIQGRKQESVNERMRQSVGKRLAKLYEGSPFNLSEFLTS